MTYGCPKHRAPIYEIGSRSPVGCAACSWQPVGGGPNLVVINYKVKENTVKLKEMKRYVTRGGQEAVAIGPQGYIDPDKGKRERAWFVSVKCNDGSWVIYVYNGESGALMHSDSRDLDIVSEAPPPAPIQIGDRVSFLRSSTQGIQVVEKGTVKAFNERDCIYVSWYGGAMWVHRRGVRKLKPVKNKWLMYKTKEGNLTLEPNDGKGNKHKQVWVKETKYGDA